MTDEPDNSTKNRQPVATEAAKVLGILVLLLVAFAILAVIWMIATVIIPLMAEKGAFR